MLSLMIAATISTSSPKCTLPFDVARTEAAARAIAQVVITSAPPEPIDKNILRYDLHIEYLRERNSWIVYQRAISAAKGVRFLGGNGIGMEIAACDGAVSDISRQR